MIREIIWKQFGAAIDMLENAILVCPDELWDTEYKFWYKSFHCLFWLDYYLFLDPENYVLTPPFTFSEFNTAKNFPDQVYSQELLLTYLDISRDELRNLLNSLTDEELTSKRWINEFKNFSVLEILLYNMRHVQHHAAQLNIFLREKIDYAPSWITQKGDNL